MGLNLWWRKLWQRSQVLPRDRGNEPTEDYPAPLGRPPSNPRSSRIRVGVVSTVGLYREHNEDNFFVPGRPPVQHKNLREVQLDEPTVLNIADHWVPLLVADGMGGQLAGEKASLMAVEMIPKELNRRLSAVRNLDEPNEVGQAVREALAEVNKEILAVSHIGTEFNNMGTTVVLELFRNDHVYIAGMGDSRAYRLRESRLERLTEDHSLADALSKAGSIRAEEVANHKYKNVLYLYLGSKDGRSGPEQVSALEVRPGDRFMMSTDGLTGVVDDEQLNRVLSSGDDPQRSAKALVDMALENQSKDNVTVMVIYVE